MKRALFCLIKEQEETSDMLVCLRSSLLPIFFSWYKLRELITRSRSTLSGLNAFFTMCCQEQRDTIKAFVTPSKTFDFPLGWAESERKEDSDWKLIGSVSAAYLHFVLLKMQLITRDEELCREMRCVALVGLLPADRLLLWGSVVRLAN